MILEDPKATTSDPDGSKFSTMEWLEALDQAKDIAVSQGASQPSMGDSNVNDFDSAMSSPSSTFDADRTLDGLNIPSSRHNLRKEQADNESLRGVKRFSKRHSKSGLAAVF